MMPIRKASFPVTLACALTVLAQADEPPVDAARLEAEEIAIGEVVLDKQNIFDTDDERENNALYRMANKLHIMTRDHTIEKQLLLKPGETYSQRLVDESERILRRNSYLYDATIEPVNLRDGVVDLKVTTRDVWTLKPGVSFSRKGGENRTGVDIEEINLFGRAQKIRIARVDDVDRTTKSLEFTDPYVGNTWISAEMAIADNSDGHSNLLSVIRPFYALDTRWSAGASGFDDERHTSFYSLGEAVAEYEHDRQQYSLFGGWSAGLRDSWVRRYRVGVIYDDNQFDTVADGTLPAVVPEDRKLVYPFVGFELLEDQFATTRNKEQIGRTEDFNLGQRLTATLGYASESFDSDRDAVVYDARYSRGFGAFESRALLATVWARGRLEDGASRNAMLGLNARFYVRQSEKHLFFVTAEAVRGHALDLDNVVELGGDSGLRGYPLRYQSGESKALITMEQRIFWDWYPFRLFRVGAAVFADAGRAWGDDPVAEADQGWMRDVGFGLRFASTRVGFRKMVHLDIAFPLDGDPSIDDVQILLESRATF